MADFPNIEPDLEEIALIANNQVYNSPLTGQAQTASLTGGKWQCTPTFSNRNGKEARDLRAFLFDQEGVSGRFNYYPASIDNIGTHAGGGVVDGAGQTGKELVTKGWDADQPLLFSAGDYLTVNGEMKMVTADVGTTGDRIEYDEINSVSGPFNPSLWNGVTDADCLYTEVTKENPSGESFVGEFEFTRGQNNVLAPFLSNNIISAPTGDYFTSFYCNVISGVNVGFSIRFRNLSGSIFESYINIDTLNTNGVGEFNISPAGDGYIVQVKHNLSAVDTVKVEVYMRSVSANGLSVSAPNVGDTVEMQSAFFGKADSFPARYIANATIPITPAIRVSPSDENAIEVENPYFPARLDTDDMSRLQVSAPVIYNTTLSIVEDF